MHIKYLLKRVQTNRSRALRFTVFNNHSGKKVEVSNEEETRFKRFLGPNVNYTSASFQAFAAEPERFY
jgi:hypothetical protein